MTTLLVLYRAPEGGEAALLAALEEAQHALRVDERRIELHRAGERMADQLG